MADHIRKQIRDAAVAALTGLASTGSNVFTGKISPLKQAELPALLIFLNGDEGSDGAQNAGATADHAGVLRVEGVAAANDDTIDLLDQIAAEVEVALFADAGFLALLLVPPDPPSTSIQIDDPAGGSALRLGSVILGFPIQFRTRLGEPSVIV